MDKLGALLPTLRSPCSVLRNSTCSLELLQFPVSDLLHPLRVAPRLGVGVRAVRLVSPPLRGRLRPVLRHLALQIRQVFLLFLKFTIFFILLLSRMI